VSEYQFRVPTEAEARDLLARRRLALPGDPCVMAETHHDAIACRRRLEPKTTAAEREASRAFNERLRREQEHELEKSQ
jgi:hypothetical protein